MDGTHLRLIAMAALMLAAGGCADPNRYMGIDIADAPASAPADPERQAAVQQRELLMLIATIEGCYERMPGGFKPVQAIKAKSFECAEKLAAIENLSTDLGLGRGPTGIEAMSLVSLARMARLGDKRAQLELGIRFEEGIGIERDMGKARSLYRQAAAATGGTIWVYSPPVGNGTTGRVIPINRGPRMPGLTEASRRLEALEQDGSIRSD